MAGNILYIGNLFANMISNLQTMVGKMDTQITKLDAISTNILNNVSAINLKPSATLYKELNNALVDMPVTANVWNDTKIRIFCKADGVVKLAMHTNVDSTKCGYAFGNETPVQFDTSVVSQIHSGLVAVRAGAVMSLWINPVSGTTNKTVNANSVKIYAEPADLAIETAFSIAG